MSGGWQERCGFEAPPPSKGQYWEEVDPLFRTFPLMKPATSQAGLHGAIGLCDKSTDPELLVIPRTQNPANSPALESLELLKSSSPNPKPSPQPQIEPRKTLSLENVSIVSVFANSSLLHDCRECLDRMMVSPTTISVVVSTTPTTVPFKMVVKWWQ